MSPEALEAIATAKAGTVVYAGIGAGLAAIGAGLGIGKIGGAANEAIARQRGFDPDLWVLEIESREGRHLLDEPGLE